MSEILLLKTNMICIDDHHELVLIFKLILQKSYRKVDNNDGIKKRGSE